MNSIQKGKPTQGLKRKYVEYVLLSFLLFTQCKSESDAVPQQGKTFTSEVSKKLVDISENEKPAQTIANILKQDTEEQKIKTDTGFTIDKEMTYVPDVQTCIYIRTSPNISDSNIIQCLIPESSAEGISGMTHSLRPTGKVKGNWAEFYYEFDVYTHKPDVQDAVFFQEWDKKRNQAHERAKKKYRAFRNSGWLKFRNEDGTLNIKFPNIGC